jgi:CRP-like cAMP-binding protein
VGVADHWLLVGVLRDEVEGLLATGREVRFLPGEVLFHEGAKADGLYLILAGSVRVFASGEEGEMYLATIQADDVLGEMGVLDGQPRSATATSVGLCVTYFIPCEPFLDLLERSSPLCMRLMAILATRLRRANGRLGELAGSPTPKEPLVDAR